MGKRNEKVKKERKGQTKQKNNPQYPSIYDIDLTIDICIYLFKTLRRQERQPIRFLNIVNTAIRRTILVRTYIETCETITTFIKFHSSNIEFT